MSQLTAKVRAEINRYFQFLERPVVLALHARAEVVVIIHGCQSGYFDQGVGKKAVASIWLLVGKGAGLGSIKDSHVSIAFGWRATGNIQAAGNSCRANASELIAAGIEVDHGQICAKVPYPGNKRRIDVEHASLGRKFGFGKAEPILSLDLNAVSCEKEYKFLDLLALSDGQDIVHHPLEVGEAGLVHPSVLAVIKQPDPKADPAVVGSDLFSVVHPGLQSGELVVFVDTDNHGAFARGI